MKKFFYFIACAAIAISCATKTADISGKWNIESACGLSTENGERPAYIIFKDGKVNGNASVNSFFGEYKYENGKLSFSAMGMTRMMGASMEIEDSVMSAINRLATLKIEGEDAVAYDAEGNAVLTLTRAAEDNAACDACGKESAQTCCNDGSCTECTDSCGVCSKNCEENAGCADCEGNCKENGENCCKDDKSSSEAEGEAD